MKHILLFTCCVVALGCASAASRGAGDDGGNSGSSEPSDGGTRSGGDSIGDATTGDASETSSGASDAGAAADVAEDVQVWTSCPPNPYKVGYNDKCGPGLIKCDYGTECCCGQCAPSTECNCYGGHFSCSALDFCLSPQCSPGCDLGRYSTPTGCEKCSAIAKVLPLAVSETMAPWTACGVDADCTTVSSSVPCSYDCKMAAAKLHLQAANKALGAMTGEWCTGYGNGCALPCVQNGSPRCVLGQCRLATPCDPTIEPNGTPCNDDDACTEDDACVSAGTCAGKPVDCDDDNPCTAESCSKGSGCQHEPLKGNCDAGVACSLGGTCDGATCKDSGAKGWTEQYPAPIPSTELGLDRLADGTFVVAHTVKTAPEVRLLRIDGSGKVVWDLPKFALGHANDVVGLADGGIAVSGTDDSPKTQYAKVWRTDAAGSLQWSLEIAAPSGRTVRIAARPEGGVVVAGAKMPAANEWHAWVARVDATGALLGTLDLGQAPNYAGLTHVAARVGTTAVLTTQAGAAIAEGPQSDIRFVRLDNAGKKVVDVAILPGPLNDFPRDLLSVEGGWLGAATRIAYGKGSKSADGLIVRVDDAGKVVWSKAATDHGLWLVRDGDSFVTGGVEAANWAFGTLHVRHFDGSGAITGDVTAPAPSVGSNVIALAATGDHGALFVSAPYNSEPLRAVRLLPPTASCP
ncbi:MAG: hypothetical protein H6747_04665 [Deltaproteobacteria bacterium]|nr:hypothetical protein [Deltaproteobacteria bacterium]